MKTAEQTNIVTLRCGAFLSECEADLQTVEPWSEEKTHIMYLLAQYIRNPALGMREKMRAMSMIAEYSDMALALAEAGYKRTITVTQFERENLGETGKNKVHWATS